eukprot:s3481_g3.t1
MCTVAGNPCGQTNHLRDLDLLDVERWALCLEWWIERCRVLTHREMACFRGVVYTRAVEKDRGISFQQSLR